MTYYVDTNGNTGVSPFDTKRLPSAVIKSRQGAFNKPRDFAFKAHEGQMYGLAPYSYHLTQVDSQFHPLWDGMCHDVAWLHDVLEDTDVTEADLLREFGFEVTWAVMLLTKQEDISYEVNILTIAASGNRTAIRVKIADNKANLSNSGKKNLDSRYKKSIKVLEEALERLGDEPLQLTTHKGDAYNV